MKYLDELFKRNKPNKNKLVEQNYEVSKQSRMLNLDLITDSDEFRMIKRILEPAVKKAVKEIEEKGIKPDKFVSAIIPPEFIEGMKDGKYKFMEALDGSLLPNIVNEKNQIVKKVRLEEIEVAPKDLNAVNQ